MLKCTCLYLALNFNVRSIARGVELYFETMFLLCDVFVMRLGYAFVMVIDYLFRVVHAAVTDLDGVSVEDFSELVIFRKVLVY